MKYVRLFLTTAALLCAVLAAAQDQKPAPTHVMVDGAQLKWGPPPPVLNKGAELAVVSGDPGSAGPYVIRLKMPAGYKIAPHWHPTDENITVIAGTFSLGMGETFDPKATKTLAAGGFALMPAEMRHFAWTKGGATVQVHGMGPFMLNYVNPADDPSKGAPAK
jgi:quercetin dioxygenase-like cupin family protein